MYLRVPHLHPFRIKQRSAFSMIELLVCIAVIALLVTLLTPFIRQSRDVASAALCAGNLRGVGSALLTYATENGGDFPAMVEGYNPTTGMWMETLSPYLFFSLTHRNHTHYYCPQVDVNSSPRRWGSPDYGPNDKMLVRRNSSSGPQGEQSGIALVNLASVLSPAETLLVADAAPARNPNWGSWFLLGDDFIRNWDTTGMQVQREGAPALRHGSGKAFNAVFVDGHVESLRADDAKLSSISSRRKFLGP